MSGAVAIFAGEARGVVVFTQLVTIPEVPPRVQMLGVFTAGFITSDPGNYQLPVLHEDGFPNDVLTPGFQDSLRVVPPGTEAFEFVVDANLAEELLGHEVALRDRGMLVTRTPIVPVMTPLTLTG